MRRFIPRILLVLALAGVAAGVMAGWNRYHRNRDPERLLARAGKALLTGRSDVAYDQWERALRFAADGEQRAKLTRRLIAVAEQLPPVPLPRALASFRFLLILRARAVEDAPADEAGIGAYLQLVHGVADAANTPVAWAEAAARAAQVRQWNPRSPTARKYVALALIRGPPADVDDAECLEKARTELLALQATFPDDAELPFHAALSRLFGARGLQDPGMRSTAALQADMAIRQVADFSAAHPGDPWASLHAAHIRLLATPLAKPEDAMRLAGEAAAQLAAAAAGNGDPVFVREILQLHLAAERWSGLLRARDADVRIGTPAKSCALIAAAAQRYPQDPGVQLLLADMAVAQRDFAGAEKALARVREERDAPVAVSAVRLWRQQNAGLLQLADLRLLQTEQMPAGPARAAGVAEARRLLAEYSRHCPAEGQPALLAARIGLLEERWAEAAAALDRVDREWRGTNPDAVYYCALALRNAGENGAAAARLQRFLTLPARFDEQRTTAFEELARAQLANRDFAAAAAAVRTAVERKPGDPGTRLLAGLILLGDAAEKFWPLKKPEALAEIRAFLTPAAAAGSSEAARALAQLQLLTGDRVGARDALRAWCTAHPADTEAIILLAQIESTLGDAPGARRRLEEIAGRLPPGDVKDLLQAALGPESATGDVPSTAAHLERLCRLAGASDEVQRGLGLLEYYRDTGSSRRALELSTRLLAAHPGQAALVRASFAVVLNLGQWDRARAILKSAQGVVGPVDLALWQAGLDVGCGRAAAAQTGLERTVKAFPLCSDAWAALGHVCLAADARSRAEECFGTALRLRPGHRSACEGMFRVVDARGQTRTAIRYLTDLVTFTPPDNPQGQRYLDYIEQHGSPQLALEVRQNLASMRPWDVENRRCVARLLLRLGKVDEAGVTARELLEEAPEVAANIQVMAECERAAGQAEAGKKRFRTFLATRGAQATAADWLRFADFLHEASLDADFPTAAREAIPQEDANVMPVTLAFAEWRFRRGEHAEALALFAAARGGTGSAAARLGVAECEVRLGKLKEAATDAAALVAADPQNADYAFLAARVAAARQRRADALLACARTIELAPARAHAYVLRAQLRFGDTNAEAREQVGEDLQTAVVLDPDFALARELLAQWALKQGDVERALLHLRELVSRHPTHVPYMAAVGRLDLQQRDYDALDRDLRDWEKAVPGAVEWHELRAEWERARGQSAAAAAELALVYAQKRTPAVAAAYAAALLDAGAAQKAMDLLAGLDAQTTAAPQFLGLRGRALAGCNRVGEAVALFRDGLRAAAGRPPELVRLLEDARVALPVAEQIAILKGAAGADSTGAVAYALARTRIESGEVREGVLALEWLQNRLTAGHPLQPKIKVWLGTGYEKQGRSMAAAAAYRAALQELPDDPQALLGLAALLIERMNQAGAAVPLAEKATRVTEGNPGLQALSFGTLGWAQFRAGLPLQAKANLQRAVGCREAAETQARLAEVLIACEQPAEARTALDRAEALAASERAGAELVTRIRDLRAKLPPEPKK